MVYLYDTIIRPIFQTANIIIDLTYTAPPCLGIGDYGRHYSSMLHYKTSLFVHCHAVFKKLKIENNHIIGSCLTKSLDEVRTGLALAGIKIEKVSGTLKGLEKK